jgi:hypothetical protein
VAQRVGVWYDDVSITNSMELQNEMPEILPRLEEIIPEKQRVPHNPLESGETIGKIKEEERKERERQEKIKEIVEKRDEPKKRIH